MRHLSLSEMGQVSGGQDLYNISAISTNFTDHIGGITKVAIGFAFAGVLAVFEGASSSIIAVFGGLGLAFGCYNAVKASSYTSIEFNDINGSSYQISYLML